MTKAKTAPVDEQLDDFLDDATHLVADAWAAGGWRPLELEQKYELNDLLTAFFSPDRPYGRVLGK